MSAFQHDAFQHDIEFQKILAGVDSVDAAGLMLEFAADVYPDLDRVACIEELDRLADAAVRRTMQAASIEDALRLIGELLYEDEGFHGNDVEYYDSRNSYLNEVLRRRTGIPISLGIVYMIVAQRADLPVYGTGMPGHFVLGCESEGQEPVYIDPFAGGEVLDRDRCRQRVKTMTGQAPSEDDAFRPVSLRSIASRVLRNLKLIYAASEEWAKALPVQQRLVLLCPKIESERRDLGLVLLQNGRPHQALQFLEKYAANRPTEKPALNAFLQAARRMAAEMN